MDTTAFVLFHDPKLVPELICATIRARLHKPVTFALLRSEPRQRAGCIVHPRGRRFWVFPRPEVHGYLEEKWKEGETWMERSKQSWLTQVETVEHR